MKSKEKRCLYLSTSYLIELIIMEVKADRTRRFDH